MTTEAQILAQFAAAATAVAKDFPRLKELAQRARTQASYAEMDRLVAAAAKKVEDSDPGDDEIVDEITEPDQFEKKKKKKAKDTKPIEDKEDEEPARPDDPHPEGSAAYWQSVRANADAIIAAGRQARGIEALKPSAFERRIEASNDAVLLAEVNAGYHRGPEHVARQVMACVRKARGEV